MVEWVYRKREWLRSKVREMALSRPRFGYRRIALLLQKKAMILSKNTVWSAYREECLGIKKLRRRAANRALRIRIIPPFAVAKNER